MRKSFNLSVKLGVSLILFSFNEFSFKEPNNQFSILNSILSVALTFQNTNKPQKCRKIQPVQLSDEKAASNGVVQPDGQV